MHVLESGIKTPRVAAVREKRENGSESDSDGQRWTAGWAAVVRVYAIVLVCDHVYIKTHRSANIDINFYNSYVNKVYHLFTHMKTDFTELED